MVKGGYAAKQLALLLPTTALLLALAWYGGAVSESLLRESILTRTTSRAEDLVQHIDTVLRLRIEELQSHMGHRFVLDGLREASMDLGHAPDLDALLDARARDWERAMAGAHVEWIERVRTNDVSRALREELMDFYRRKYGSPVFSDAVLTEEHGTVIALSGESAAYRRSAERWWVESRLRGLSIDDIPYQPATGDWWIPLAVRVDEPDGTFRGVLRILLSGGELLLEARVDSGITPDTDVRILTREGAILYANPQLTRGCFAQVLERIQASNGRLSGSFTHSAPNGDWLVSFARSAGQRNDPGPGWIAVISLDERQAVAPIARLRQRLGAGVTVAALVGLAAMVLLSLSFIRPLRRLTEVIQTRGTIPAWRRIDGALQRRRDEIGGLAGAFAAMGADMERARELRDHAHDLLASLGSAVRHVLAARSEDDVMQAVEDTARQLGHSCVVFRLEPDGGSLALHRTLLTPALVRIVETLSGAPLLSWSFVPRPEGAFSRVIASRAAVFVPAATDLLAEVLPSLPAASITAMASVAGMSEAICAALEIDGAVRYVLTIAGNGLHEEDAAAVAIFAGQASAALASARLLHAVEQKVVERTEELAHERARLRALIDSVPDLIYVKDRECRFVLCNRAQLRMLGVERESEVIGKTDFDIYPPEMARGFYEDDRRVVDAGEPILDREEQAADPEGTAIWLSTVKVPIRGSDGTVVGLAGIGRDITLRRRAEEEVRSLAQFPQQNPNAIIRIGGDERVIYANPPGRALLASWECFAEGKLPVEVEAAVKEVLASGRLREMEIASAEKTYAATVAPVTGADYVNFYAHNITESKALYARLLQAQKMESVGRLAGGIAHDFNNLMGVVIGYSEMLLSREMEAQRRLEVIGEIRRAGERAASLTQQLLAFSRKQVLQERVLHLNDVISGATGMIQRLIGDDVRVVNRLAPGLRRVKADRTQLEQVLMNLVVNARDAMPSGGTLTIETSNVELDAAYVLSHPESSLGGYVLVSVTDTGTGMDEDVRSHLFEPFFTTKELGKGTGLGLSTVYGIVRQSGGHIWVYSEPQRGSTFKVYPPRGGGTDEPLREEPVTAPRAAADRRAATILLVEDEEMLRTLFEVLLRGDGHRVIAARDAEEAIALLGASGKIDLLVTDVVLPGMSGQSLSDRLAAEIPGLRCLFMSGYTDQTVWRNGGLRPGAPFLQKPFSSDLLLSKIQDVLATPQVQDHDQKLQ